jgi:hypothetical protein
MVEQLDSFSFTAVSVASPARTSIAFLVYMFLLLRRHMNFSLQFSGTRPKNFMISNVN